jgi:hypothetical protein
MAEERREQEVPSVPELLERVVSDGRPPVQTLLDDRVVRAELAAHDAWSALVRWKSARRLGWASGTQRQVLESP